MVSTTPVAWGGPSLLGIQALGHSAGLERPAASSMPTLENIGLGLAIGGVVSSAIGAFAAVSSSQYQAEMKAAELEHHQWMSNFNARNAELAAQEDLRAGQEAAGRSGLQYGQAKATVVAKQAARGIQGGVGSAKEIAASVDLSKEIDHHAITRSAMNRATAERMRAASLSGAGLVAGASAQNLRSTAGAMMPELAGFTSLLGGGANVAGEWLSAKRQNRMYEAYLSRGVS